MDPRRFAPGQSAGERRPACRGDRLRRPCRGRSRHRSGDRLDVAAGPGPADLPRCRRWPRGIDRCRHVGARARLGPRPRAGVSRQLGGSARNGGSGPNDDRGGAVRPRLSHARTVRDTWRVTLLTAGDGPDRDRVSAASGRLRPVMFDTLSDKLEQTVKRLRGHGRISERNIEDAVREVRVALLEADVQLDVARDFTERVRTQSLGADVLASLTPEQHFIKIVRAELTRVMGERAVDLDLSAAPPVVLMLVGLNGAGKTTTVAKLAQYLKRQRGRAPYLVPADVSRPAATEQLAMLAEQVGVPVHPTASGDEVVAVCRAGVEAARNRACDVVLLDTAGRLQIDEPLMAELERVRAAVTPHQTLLVVDAMTGQDAVNVATGFNARVVLSGVIMTKLDGDARGGAALSVRAATGAPIVFAGTGEKLDAFEVFHPDRMATRILGMGDVLTLIERAEQAYDEKEALKLQRKLRRNEFTLTDFAEQMKAIKKMGSLGDLVGMIPGLKKVAGQVDSEESQRELKRIQAIIDSMTLQERENHLILNGKRRARIAGGSGTSVQDVNRFLKQFEQTRKVMKKLTRMGAGRAMMRGMGLG